MSFIDKITGRGTNGHNDDYDNIYSQTDYDDTANDYAGEDYGSDYSEDYTGDYGNDYEEYEEPVQPKKKPAYNSRVVDINSNSQVQVVVAKPINFSEVTGISDHLNAKRTVVLNLEECIANQNPNEPSIARRIVDFIGGVAYANDGKINRIAKSTYIIIPRNVDLLGDLADEEYDDKDVFSNEN